MLPARNYVKKHSSSKQASSSSWRPYLERGPGDEQAVVGGEHADGLGEQAVFVLDAVRLVDDDVAPAELLERVLLLDDHLVARDAHVELARHHLVILLVRLHERGKVVTKCS